MGNELHNAVRGAVYVAFAHRTKVRAKFAPWLRNQPFHLSIEPLIRSGSASVAHQTRVRVGKNPNLMYVAPWLSADPWF